MEFKQFNDIDKFHQYCSYILIYLFIDSKLLIPPHLYILKKIYKNHKL